MHVYLCSGGSTEGGQLALEQILHTLHHWADELWHKLECFLHLIGDMLYIVRSVMCFGGWTQVLEELEEPARTKRVLRNRFSALDQHLKVVCHVPGPYCGGTALEAATPLAAFALFSSVAVLLGCRRLTHPKRHPCSESMSGAEDS